MLVPLKFRKSGRAIPAVERLSDLSRRLGVMGGQGLPFWVITSSLAKMLIRATSTTFRVYLTASWGAERLIEDLPG